MRKRIVLRLGPIALVGCVGTISDPTLTPPASDSKDANAAAQDSQLVQDASNGADRTADQNPTPAADSSAEGAETTSLDSGHLDGDSGHLDGDAAMIEMDANGLTSSDVADVANADPETGRLVGITAAHNAIRAKVQTSMPLGPLVWSPVLADYAQQWATTLASSPSTCAAPQHRPGSDLVAHGYGENLATFGGAGFNNRDGSAAANVSTAMQAVDAWASEVMCWTYGTIRGTEQCNATCTTNLHSDGCGHYTQIVWRKSTQVGCGVASCKIGSRTQDIWICNYAPEGNFVGQAPY
jgi:pathogenesis-related protein 1